MTLITYPLDDCDYSADDAALFHCTRTSGIFASDDFSFSVSGSDNTVRIGPGIAWMRINKFKGLVAALKNEVSVDLGLTDSVYPRIDRVVLQYNANTRDTTVVVKRGVPRSNPLPPDRSTEEALYELHLLEVIAPEDYEGMTTVALGQRIYEAMAADLGPELVSEEKA